MSSSHATLVKVLTDWGALARHLHGDPLGWKRLMAHLVAGEWQDAGWAAEKVLQQHRKESCPRSLGRRMLSEAHFERERRISPRSYLDRA